MKEMEWHMMKKSKSTKKKSEIAQQKKIRPMEATENITGQKKQRPDDTTSAKNENEEKEKNVVENIKRINRAIQIAGMAIRIFNLMQLYLLLKRFFWYMMQMAIAAAKAVWNGIMALTNAVKTFFGKGFTFHLFGRTIVLSAKNYVIAFAFSAAGSIGTAALTGYQIATFFFHPSEKDAAILDENATCETAILQSNVTSDTSKTLSIDEKKQEHINIIYSILSSAGFADTNIAGILGNWHHESEMDPTAFFGIYGENYKIGPKKQEVIDNGYKDTAIGLGQWRGGRKTNLIKFGESYNEDGIWYDTETQVMFTLTADGGDTTNLNEWKKTEAEDPETAAIWFGSKWERAGLNSYEDRAKTAAKYYEKIENGKVEADLDYGDSVLEASKYTSSVATDTATREETYVCSRLYDLSSSMDNSSIVKAAISLCHSYTTFASDSVRSKEDCGTQLYQEVNDAIHPGNKVYSKYRDCGKYVSSVIRWCGADKSYCTGATSEQIKYLQSSDKWEEIKWEGHYENLSPGDVLIKYEAGGTHHVCIYAGYEDIKEAFPDTPDDKDVVICSASMDGSRPGYPPCCRNYYSDLSSFHAFRCVKPDNDTTYQNIGINTVIGQTAQ